MGLTVHAHIGKEPRVGWMPSLTYIHVQVGVRFAVIDLQEINYGAYVGFGRILSHSGQDHFKLA